MFVYAFLVDEVQDSKCVQTFPFVVHPLHRLKFVSFWNLWRQMEVTWRLRWARPNRARMRGRFCMWRDVQIPISFRPEGWQCGYLKSEYFDSPVLLFMIHFHAHQIRGFEKCNRTWFADNRYVGSKSYRSGRSRKAPYFFLPHYTLLRFMFRFLSLFRIWFSDHGHRGRVIRTSIERSRRLGPERLRKSHGRWRSVLKQSIIFSIMRRTNVWVIEKKEKKEKKNVWVIEGLTVNSTSVVFLSLRFNSRARAHYPNLPPTRTLFGLHMWIGLLDISRIEPRHFECSILTRTQQPGINNASLSFEIYNSSLKPSERYSIAWASQVP